ncbi:hypothetical protein HJFPF1_06973 [Paramyrothecium foliicola]|nr:hypothetical protein HJFPF1_06973 [Paramyrothecium foliicola]
MEPIGLAASIITICALGRVTIKVSRKIQAIARTASNLNEDINRVAKPLLLSGRAIELAYKQLQLHDIKNSSSSLLRHILDKDTLKALDWCVGMAGSKLKELPGRLSSIIGKWRFLAAFEWLKEKRGIDELVVMLESIKTSTIVLVHTARLEVLKLQWRDGSETLKQWLSKEIVIAKGQLKAEEWNLKELRHSSLKPGADGGNIQFIDKITTVIVSLEKLSKSMRKEVSRVQKTVSSDAIPTRRATQTQDSPPNPVQAEDLRISSGSRYSSARDAQPASSTLFFDPAKIERCIKGSISGNRYSIRPLRKDTEAFLSSGCSFNMISIRKARNLALEILELEADDPREIRYLDDRTPPQRIIGKVEAIWWHGLTKHSQSVSLFVTEHADHIIFGTNFHRSTY